MENKIAVLAGSREEFIHFCRSLAGLFFTVDPDLEAFVYIGIPEDLRGCTYDRVIRIGTWYKRKDLQHIEELLWHCLRDSEDILTSV